MSKSPKSEVLKVADALAAQSRILRKAAAPVEQPKATLVVSTTEEGVIAHLDALAAAHKKSQVNEHYATVEEIRKKYAPLVAEAKSLHAKNAAAVEECGPFVRRLATLDWPSIKARSSNTVVPGSSHDTMTRLSLLQRTVTEAVSVLDRHARNQENLKKWIDAVNQFDGTEAESRNWDSNGYSRLYAANELKFHMSSHGDLLRQRMAAIRKTLREVAADLVAADAGAVNEEAR